MNLIIKNMIKKILPLTNSFKRMFQKITFLKKKDKTFYVIEPSSNIDSSIKDAIEEIQALSWSKIKKGVKKKTPHMLFLAAQNYFWGIHTSKDMQNYMFYIQKGAELHSAECLYELSTIYQKGLHGYRKNDLKAFLFLRSAAELGYIRAFHNLGVFYLYGTGVEKDEKIGFSWIEKSANAGIVFSKQVLEKFKLKQPFNNEKTPFKIELNRPIKGIDSIDSVQKLSWEEILKRVDDNDPAMTFVAFIAYTQGIDGAVDTEKAKELLVKSAELNCPEGVYELAIMHLKGTLGFEMNKQKAFELTKRAAELGLTLAYHDLACFYFMGDGIAQNKEIALEWFKKSAAAGFEDSQEQFERLEKEYNEAQEQAVRNEYGQNKKTQIDFEEVLNTANNFKILGNSRFTERNALKEIRNLTWNEIEKEIQETNPHRLYLAAISYFYGIYLKQNFEAGKTLLEKSVELNYADAIYFTASLYFVGKFGFEQNIQESIIYYKRAADSNYILAYYKLGLLYLYGCGVPQDIEIAWDWLEKSGAAGHAESQAITLELGLKRLDQREESMRLT